MSAYGFELVSRDEAKDMGLPDGSGLFSELFLYMMDEIAKNKFKAKDYEKASSMSGYEKKISFLNRYFVYKKIRTVNIDDVEIDLGEYADSAVSRNAVETKHAQEVAVEEVAAIKPKVRKLSKKLLLVAATDAIDDAPIPTKAKAKAKASKASEPKEKKTVKRVTKKALVIESDEDA
jgi:hypothetical protein